MDKSALFDGPFCKVLFVKAFKRLIGNIKK